MDKFMGKTIMHRGNIDTTLSIFEIQTLMNYSFYLMPYSYIICFYFYSKIKDEKRKQFLSMTNYTYLSSIRILSQISAFSSAGNRFGTSPLFNKLLISSKNDSSLICVSQNRKTR